MERNVEKRMETEKKKGKKWVWKTDAKKYITAKKEEEEENNGKKIKRMQI